MQFCIQLFKLGDQGPRCNDWKRASLDVLANSKSGSSNADLMAIWWRMRMLLANVDSMKIWEGSNNHTSAIVLQLLFGTSERVKTQWDVFFHQA